MYSRHNRRDMSENILDEILNAIEMRRPELLVIDDVDIKHFNAVRENYKVPSVIWKGMVFGKHTAGQVFSLFSIN